jgi:outer membrane protein assembly factor BamB
VFILTACGGRAGDSWAGISASPDSDIVYVSYNDQIVALNPTSGATLWSYKDDSKVKFYAVPVVSDGVVYVGDYQGNLHAIGSDGQQLWVYKPERKKLVGPLSPTPTDRIIGGVAVDSDKVFFGLGSRNVVAVSRTNAEKVWTFETKHGVWATPLYIQANPEVENSQATVYVVSLDHHLYALDAETGHQLWEKDLGGAAPGKLVYDEGRNRVYVGTFASELLAIDLATHDIVARYETEDWVWGSPAFADDVLYFGDLGGQLYAVRVTDTGFDPVWKKGVSKEAIRATPLLTDGLVIVGSKDKHVYAVKKEDGSPVWDTKTKGEVLTELVLVPGDEDPSDVVVVGTTDADRLIMAYQVDTGDEAWHYSAKN